MIPVYRPYLPKSCLKYAHEALDSGWLSHGPYLEKTTEKLKELLDSPYVLLTNNGTTATHLVAKAVTRFYPCRTQLIVPNNVYVAAWNGFHFDEIFFQGNFFEVTDTDLKTWNADLSFLEKLSKCHNHYHFDHTQSVVFLAVHNLGNIINVPRLKNKYPNLLIVEDNCEGFLGKYEGKYAGTASFVSSISFFGNKNITCGEGGAVLIQDDYVYDYLKCIHGQGQSEKKFVHSELGYNYRMTNIQAAILYGQLEVLPEILERKQSLFNRYREHFSDVDGVHLQQIEKGTEHSNWMFGLRILGSHYEEAEKFFKDRQVEIRPMFYPISAHPYMEGRYDLIGDEVNAQLLNQECIILPSYPDLTEDEIKHILRTVEEYVAQIKIY